MVTKALQIYVYFINFNIMRSTPLKKNINQNICSVAFNDAYYVNVFNTHKYLYYKGFTFVELSEELISYFYASDIDLSGEIYDNYSLAQNNNDKIIVLIDIDLKTILSELKTCNNLEKIKLTMPYINTSTGKQLITIEKIGNTKIHNIDNLEQILSLNIKKKIICHNTTIMTYEL